MFRIDCLNCGKSCKQNLCSECEDRLILACLKRDKTILSDKTSYELIYFWDFNAIARKLIISGKYKFKKNCFTQLAQTVFDNFSTQLNFEDCLVSYVPTTYLRYCYRGFNQAKVVSKIIGKSPIKVLKRTTYTKSQLKNTGIERRVRSNQFKVCRDLCKVKQIVIFDDVCTTGSTLINCAEAIKEKYPNMQISFVTLAYRKKKLN